MGFCGDEAESEVIILRRASAICLVVVIAVLLLFSAALPGFAAGTGTWSASYDSNNNCIDVAATPPAGPNIGTTVVWWDAANADNMQIAVADSDANPLTLSITSTMIQQALGIGAPATGNQYVVQVYFVNNLGTISGYGGQATVTWGDQNSGTAQGTAPVGSGASSSGTTTSKDTGGLFETIIADLVNVPVNMIESLFEAGGFQTLDKLIFQQGLTAQQIQSLPWESNEPPQIVSDWFLAMCAITIPFFLIAVIVSAYRFLYGAANPAARSEAMESIQRWFLAIGIIVITPLLLHVLMWASSIMITGITGAFGDVATKYGATFTTGSWAQMTFSGKISLAGVQIDTGSILGNAIVSLFLAFLFGYINVIFIIRGLALTVMFAFTPIMALFWAMNKRTTAVVVWLGEIASNVFLPVAYALVLTTLMLIINLGATSWITIVVMLYASIPIAETIRKALQSVIAQGAGGGEERGALGAMATMMGVGALMGLGNVGRATFGSTPIRTGGNTPTVKRQNGPQTTTSRQIDFGARERWSTGPAGESSGGAGASSAELPGNSSSRSAGLAPHDGSACLVGDNISGGPPQQMGAYHFQGNAQSAEGKSDPAPAGRHEKAVRFGNAVGTVAGIGAAAVLGMAAIGIPGAGVLAAPVSRVIGVSTRFVATGAHLAGGHVASKAGQSLQKAARGGNKFARVAIGAGQKISSMSQKVISHPFTQHAATVVHAGVHPKSAVQKARYRDNGDYSLL